MPEPTILTKWGQVTTARWLELKQQERLDQWLPPHKLHLVLIRAPFYIPGTQIELTDPAFEQLLNEDPAAAAAQLEAEFLADQLAGIKRRQRLEAKRKASAKAVDQFVNGTRRSRVRRVAQPHSGAPAALQQSIPLP